MLKMKPSRYLCTIVVGIAFAALATSLQPHHAPIRADCQRLDPRKGSPCSTALQGWQDWVQELFPSSVTSDESPEISRTAGTVVRLAAKAFDSASSMPSSRKYTTRKVEFESVVVSKDGVQGDYNHYRTVALQSTTGRALSILTTDIMRGLSTKYPDYGIRDGDLGENVLVDGLPFDFFRVGRRYEFVSPLHDELTVDREEFSAVIVEITEKMDPCANLCKLSYINKESLEPKDRIKRCKGLIEYLDQRDGYRGWYAKVIQEGEISSGFVVREIKS